MSYDPVPSDVESMDPVCGEESDGVSCVRSAGHTGDHWCGVSWPRSEAPTPPQQPPPPPRS